MPVSPSCLQPPVHAAGMERALTEQRIVDEGALDARRGNPFDHVFVNRPQHPLDRVLPVAPFTINFATRES